ncbi:unnamed protein product, partial [Mesorhabditis spiculigera]
MGDVEVETPTEARTLPAGLYGPGPCEGVEYPLTVAYCGACSLPCEYCEFAGMKDACREWAEKNVPGMLEKLEVAPADEDEKKHQKRGGKGNKPGGGAEKKKAAAGPSKVTLQREPRGKKSVTVIRGLAANGIDLKQASKQFASKFACGSSVTAADEIVIQGDVKDNLFDFIPLKWPQIEEDLLDDLGDKKR